MIEEARRWIEWPNPWSFVAFLAALFHAICNNYWAEVDLCMDTIYRVARVEDLAPDPVGGAGY